MTPVAAYHLFLAEENERAAAKAYRFHNQRPSLLDRLRAVGSTLGLKRSVKRSVAHPA